MRAQYSSETGNFGSFATESKFEHQPSTILTTKNRLYRLITFLYQTRRAQIYIVHLLVGKMTPH